MDKEIIAMCEHSIPYDIDDPFSHGLNVAYRNVIRWVQEAKNNEKPTRAIEFNEREIELLLSALDDTIDNLDQYIRDGNDESSIEGDRQVQNEYLAIGDKFVKVDKEKPAPKENELINDPNFLEIV